jgi:methylated-DNA-[protein]-cysteine S-methyltransferase
MPDFKSRVLSVVRRIPVGRVATYGDVAAAAGSPRASRAVGNIMRACGGRGVPCHRVVAAAGRLGGYGGNLELKRALLRAEGLTVTRTAVREFQARRWPSVVKRDRGRPGRAVPGADASAPGNATARRRSGGKTGESRAT